ncbi:MAG: signal peptidase II [Actinomycetota bacterium]|nr:signal peptidase II [Actinomycetota bacterium]
MPKRKSVIVFASSTLISLAIDQLTKLLIALNIQEGRSITVIPHVLWITHTKNTGAAFGLMAGKGGIIFFCSLFLIILLLVWLFSRSEKRIGIYIALGAIVGGALGNLTDRIIRGKVVDFIDLGWWPVFNLADTLIVIGVIMFLIVFFLEDRKKTE